MTSTHTHYSGVATRGQPEPSRFGCGPLRAKGQAMTIKAIETRYRGYRFRSRLEARWAVFFDALGIEWQYEPEGFELADGTRYLPDFSSTTPTGRTTYYEIKPRGVTSDPKGDSYQTARSLDLFRAAADGVYESQFPELILLAGDPHDWVESIRRDHLGKWDGGVCPRCGVLRRSFESGIMRNGDEDGVGCGACDMETPCGSGNPVEPGVLAETQPHKGWLLLPSDTLEWIELRVIGSAVKARSARFEHGECVA